MRIAIDARLNAYRQGGIPQYTRQLVAAMAELAHETQIVTLQHREHQRPLTLAPNVKRHTIMTPPHHRYEQWTLPLEVVPIRPHVLHCPDFIAPRRRLWPAVVTIHDLTFLRYPEILDDQARAFYSRVKESATHAEGVIAVSESTRQDIAQFLDIAPEQIDVVYEAAASLFYPIDLRADEVRVLNGTPVSAGSFMLFVSTLEPRKNLPTLFQALRICIDRRPDRAYRLVVAGARGWRDDAIYSSLRDNRVEDHVTFAGKVGDYDLRWLYNACRLYINPSLYEGFGLPLLEAMACGAACLASAASSLPEIGGDAALYVSPLEAEEWANAIETLWEDEERRSELGRRGKQRAQQFSWARAARETLAIYQRVANGAPIPLQTLHQRPAATSQTPYCPRCRTGLVSGRFEPQIAITLDGPAHAGQAFSPVVWACIQCGWMEMAQRPSEQPQSPPESSNGHASSDEQIAHHAQPLDGELLEPVGTEPYDGLELDGVEREEAPIVEPGLEERAAPSPVSVDEHAPPHKKR